MESEQQKVDRQMLDFARTTVFDSADFTIRSNGVVRLNPQVARVAVARVHQDQMRTGACLLKSFPQRWIDRETHCEPSLIRFTRNLKPLRD
jgi:hypothetical protein